MVNYGGKDERSKPDKKEWRLMSCILKRNNIPTYELADAESSIMEENSDTDANDVLIGPPTFSYLEGDDNYNPKAEPGQAFDNVVLNITCNTGYLVKSKDKSQIFCINGIWSEQITDCSRSCRLQKDPTVKYTCLLKDINHRRECTDQEPEGTVIQPVCNLGYYTSTPLPQMRCIAGSWNYPAKCIPECGRLPLKPENLILNGPAEERIPWNAAIYRKPSKTHICGGTLVSPNVVISAGHCFWNTHRNKPESPDRYIVSLGKQYRSFDDPRDMNSQTTDVSFFNRIIKHQPNA
ncbi:unnamed protein product [Diatraea saccharalis]|uniref:Peptidase S1 domain-containing protein n=1 Tax=Diatraea saccharalis TaxID=40085 RepID=A0A9N9R599_9NEOP|nr:unnamed protein product [Diatraea saccharalis]